MAPSETDRTAGENSSTKKLTRRRVLAASGAGLTALAGVYYSTDTAQAVTVNVNDFTIPDQEKSAPTAPNTIMLRLTGEYAVEANVVPDKLVLTPKAKTADSTLGMHTFQSEEVLLNSKTHTGQIDLERDLRALSGLRDVFPASEGGSITKEMTVELVAEVVADGSVIGSDTASVAFPLTLGHDAATASIGWSVSGDVVLE